MKKKTFKRLAWAAGITFVLLLTLTVFPGLNYNVKGPWDTRVKKGTVGAQTYFEFWMPHHQFCYITFPEKDAEHWGPEGFYSTGERISFRVQGSGLPVLL